ncbi:MAG TPA: efflux RND transporter periplasmic adaptor subunit [Desulfobacteraceae bacterium]|nr:efflux RND transporter periplasmic adaptor subunit [Desulfobacteraceae bacterium]
MQSMKRMKLAAVAVFAAAAAMLAAGCDRNTADQPPPPVPRVSTVTVRLERIVLTSELPGRTSPYRIAEIRPRVNGLIQKRLFTEGSDVEAGQVLYQIDPAPFRATLANARAALARAEANLPSAQARSDRFEQLVAENAVSRQDYDDAVAALTAAKADVEYWKAMVETADINLEYTSITAPISGRIGRSSVTDGAIVTAYQPTPLATIQQLDPIYADMPQSTTELLRLQRRLEKGLIGRGNEKDGRNTVSLIQEDGTPYPLEGTLQFSDVTVDPTTGSVTLRAIFPNPDGMLLPGMFIKAAIREGICEEAILIPQQGVSRDPKGNPYALIVDAENKAASRPLTLDRAIGDKWLVAEGLEPGDRLIVEGLLMLRPGMAVQAASLDGTQEDPNPPCPLDESADRSDEGGR